MRCLWRYCAAEIEPVTQLVRPRSSATERVIPIHDVAGRHSWFGRCPASGVLLHRDNRISQTAVDVLTAADGTFERMHDEREARRPQRAVETTQGGTVDNLRDQLKALARLAADGFGQAQETCAKTTEEIKQLQRLLVELEQRAQAAMALSRAAIGSPDSAPEAANNMVGSGHVGLLTIDDAQRTASALLDLVEVINQSMQAAATAANAYAEIP